MTASRSPDRSSRPLDLALPTRRPFTADRLAPCLLVPDSLVAEPPIGPLDARGFRADASDVASHPV